MGDRGSSCTSVNRTGRGPDGTTGGDSDWSKVAVAALAPQPVLLSEVIDCYLNPLIRFVYT